jgi:hypothetical protein
MFYTKKNRNKLSTGALTGVMVSSICLDPVWSRDRNGVDEKTGDLQKYLTQ